ncbi:MAG: DUF1501 domain-containing protein, partial [Pseudomonadota bacterium]
PSGDPNSGIMLGAGMSRSMNPNLEPLMELWDAGALMVSPATQFSGSNRSHFDCQRWIGNGMESNLVDGYLNRFLQDASGGNHPLRGLVAGKGSMSQELFGEISVPVINRQSDFNLSNQDFCSGNGCADNQLTEIMTQIASHPVQLPEMEEAVRDTQMVMIESIAEVQMAGADYTPDAGGLDYSNRDIGRGLKLMAQLLKAGVPIEVAALDWNIGWDSHSGQVQDIANPIIDQEVGYNRNMRGGAVDFVTFFRDMGPLLNDVVVLVCTEFGRTVKENGSRGTDHGHGSTWFAFGGPTIGGMADDVPNLAEENLIRDRYVPVVIEYKDIVAEIMIRHMGLPENLVSTIFPGHTFTNHSLFAGGSV